MAEGFPRPPISIELAKTSFVLAIPARIVLFLKRWLTIELLLYSLFPFLLLYTFDEISDLTSQFANALEAEDIQFGDHVAIMLEPSLAFYVSLFGTVKRLT